MSDIFSQNNLSFNETTKCWFGTGKKKTEKTIFNQERTRMAENGENFFNDNKWLTCTS